MFPLNPFKNCKTVMFKNNKNLKNARSSFFKIRCPELFNFINNGKVCVGNDGYACTNQALSNLSRTRESDKCTINN